MQNCGTQFQSYSYSTTPAPKAQRSFWKILWNDCKSQKNTQCTVIRCLQEMSGRLHPWSLINTATKHDLKKTTPIGMLIWNGES